MYGGSMCILRENGIKTQPELETLGVVGLEFAEKAQMLREQCKVERIESVQKWQEKQENQGKQWWQGSWETWQDLVVIIDSGAAETVIPHTAIPDHPVKETLASKSGICYSSATDEPIPNLGEQKVPLLTNEGSVRMMTCQVAPVARPLGSVRRMCHAGHRVVFDSDGSYIQNKATGETNWLREENGNYILDMKIIPGQGWYGSTNPGFGGQR